MKRYTPYWNLSNAELLAQLDAVLGQSPIIDELANRLEDHLYDDEDVLEDPILECLVCEAQVVVCVKDDGTEYLKGAANG